MTPANTIIERFGGVRALARTLGHKHPSTVQGWKDRGFIPLKHAAAIMAASHGLDKPVRADDFIAVGINRGVEPADRAEALA